MVSGPLCGRMDESYHLFNEVYTEGGKTEFPPGYGYNSSIAKTPSMTRASSLFSPSSSAETCEGCSNSSQRCSCPNIEEADTSYVRLQQDTGYLRSLVESPGSLGPQDKSLLSILDDSGESILHVAAVGLSLPNPISRFQKQHPVAKETISSSAIDKPVDNVSDSEQREKPGYKGKEAILNHREYRSESSADEDEGSDEQDDNDENDWGSQEGNVEGIALGALGDDPALAAHIIPMLHKTYRSKIKENIERKVQPWVSNIANGTGTSNISRGQSPETNTVNESTNSHKRKRQRRSYSRQRNADGYEGWEDEFDEDEDDSRQPKRNGTGPETSTAQEPSRLACPFYKRDPLKYSISKSAKENSDGINYRTCEGPGFISIQRLKEHLKRKHSPVQCDRCYETFHGANRSACALALEKHMQQPVACDRQDSKLKEGISDAQWAKLVMNNGTKRLQTASRIDKWLSIWDILFPEAQRPATPWYDAQLTNQLRLGVAGSERRTFSVLFESMLSVKLNQKDIIFPDGMEDTMRSRIVSLVEKTFEVHLGIYGHSTATIAGSIQTHSLRRESAQQASAPSTVIDRSSASGSRLAAPRSQNSSQSNSTDIGRMSMPPPMLPAHWMPVYSHVSSTDFLNLSEDAIHPTAFSSQTQPSLDWNVMVDSLDFGMWPNTWTSPAETVPDNNALFNFHTSPMD